jgi:hypothetical protein
MSKDRPSQGGPVKGCVGFVFGTMVRAFNSWASANSGGRHRRKMREKGKEDESLMEGGRCP